MMTTYDFFYEEYLREGYLPWWAEVKAEIAIKELQEHYIDQGKPFKVNIPSIGVCSYTGD